MSVFFIKSGINSIINPIGDSMPLNFTVKGKKYVLENGAWDTIWPILIAVVMMCVILAPLLVMQFSYKADFPTPPP